MNEQTENVVAFILTITTLVTLVYVLIHISLW